MINTPVMEGLNLLPLEYQFCHKEPAGVVIVSEFSACSRKLVSPSFFLHAQQNRESGRVPA